MLNPLFALALMLFVLSPQAPQTPPASQQPAAAPAQAAAPPATPAISVIPVEAARMVNPVTPTPESQARAKTIYGYDCAMCHGANGDGKGEVATDMKLTTKNFTDPAALKNRTDGELFYIIKNGQGQMPGEGTRAKPDEMWNLVIYVRSFAKQ
ncbi:MAG TPA: cytochrome c [Acidobacteriaceae bacterium]|nr:cytochrome c [Acidobacteriaceae bacterium]